MWTKRAFFHPSLFSVQSSAVAAQFWTSAAAALFLYTTKTRWKNRRAAKKEEAAKPNTTYTQFQASSERVCAIFYIRPQLAKQLMYVYMRFNGLKIRNFYLYMSNKTKWRLCRTPNCSVLDTVAIILTFEQNAKGPQSKKKSLPCCSHQNIRDVSSKVCPQCLEHAGLHHSHAPRFEAYAPQRWGWRGRKRHREAPKSRCCWQPRSCCYCSWLD